MAVGKKEAPHEKKRLGRQRYFRTGPSQEWIFSAPSRNRAGIWGYLDLLGRVARRFAVMLKYKLKPWSSIQRTKATSATSGWGGSSVGDNEGPRQESSRPWNVQTQTTHRRVEKSAYRKA